MTPRKRAALAFIVAPIAPSLLFAVAILSASWATGDRITLLDWLLGSLALALWLGLYAYVAQLAVGVPAFLLLSYFATPRLWHALAIGMATGAAMATVLTLGQWNMVIFGALMGLATARVFWAVYAISGARTGAA